MGAGQNWGSVSATKSSLKDLAPDVFRQRMLVEGHFGGTMTRDRVRSYLLKLTAALNLKTYGDPVIFRPDSGMGSDENAGFDAFVPLIDSGISAYFWTGPEFFSVVLYSCKRFDSDKAIAETRTLLGVEGEIVAHLF